MKIVSSVLWGFVYGFAIIGAGAAGLVVGDRVPPITYESAKALSETVPQGGSMDIEFKVYRYRLCPNLVRRFLLDSDQDKHSIPSYTIGLSRFVGSETYRRKITIPIDAAVGPAIYQVSIDYYCNPFHRLGFPITVEAPDVNFDITPAFGLVPFGMPGAGG